VNNQTSLSDQPPSGVNDTGDSAAAVNVHYDTRLPKLSRWRRMQIPVIGWAAYGLIRLIGPTLRYEYVGRQHLEQVHARGERAIFAFWHRTIFTAMWCWRGTGIAVMNTTNFDGQWTRKVVERLGFGTVQGSSSRGGLRALVEMARLLKAGKDVAFTVDGPRGPRYVAKNGPVMLARRTGQPVVLMHGELERSRSLEKSWDKLQIPRLFSRGVAVIPQPVYVDANASAEGIEEKRVEMQEALERARRVAESWFQVSEAERQRLREEWNG
jgi:lysophospholipid acyltransferase (LPLAT)-like uncharacterized protein